MATIRRLQIITNPASTNNDFASTASPAAALGAVAKKGNTLIAMLYTTAGTQGAFSVPTDNLGGSFVSDFEFSGTFSVGRIGFFSKLAAGGEQTITGHLSPSGTGSLVVCEYEGVLTPSNKDIAVSNERSTAGTTTVGLSSGTLAQDDELLLAGLLTAGGDGGSITWTQGGYTTLFDAGSGGFGELLVSAKTAITTQPTWVSSLFASLAVISYKATGRLLSAGFSGV